MWGAVAGAGGAAGVLLGGVLTSGLSWRWVLFVNVPIGVGAVSLAPRVLVESRVEDARRSFDIPGALTVTAGLSLLVYALVDAVNAGWGSAATLLKLGGAMLLLIAFVVIELRERWPLMPFSIFRVRTLRGANVVGLLVGMAFTIFLSPAIGVPLLMIAALVGLVGRMRRQASGVGRMQDFRGQAVEAQQGGTPVQFDERVGFKPTLIAGLLFVATGLAWFSRVRVGGSYAADVLGPSLLAAVGLGLSFVTVTIAAMTGTRTNEAGLASGLINTAQQVGGALGLAILATVANSRTKGLLAGGSHDVASALTKGFERAFMVGAGFAIAGALLALLLISSRDSREHATAARAQLAAAHARG